MVLPASIFLFVLYFYLRTLCTTFNINDSGETIVDCDLLSLAHSPGYPFHTLLGRLFCLLPLGQPMFRLTFGSALMGAFSTAVLYILIQKALEGRPGGGSGNKALVQVPALFGALTFAFSYQHWFQSCGAKGSIYTLNTMLAVSTLFFLMKMREAGWFHRGFLLAMFFLGLGLSVHWETQVVLLPAYGWLLMTAQDRVEFGGLFKNLLRPFDLGPMLGRLARAFGDRTFMVRAAALALVPLSTYLFLPIRAHGGPAINWWDPGVFSRFLTVVTRGNYAGTDDPRSFVTFFRNLDRFWLQAQDQYGAFFTLLLAGLALAGSFRLFKDRRGSAPAFLLFGGGVLAGVLFYNAPREGYQWTLDNFFTPAFLSFSFFAAGGWSALFRFWTSIAPQRLALWAFGALCLGSALLPLGLNYERNDQSAYTVSYDEGMNMLRTAQRDGIILCNGDIDILPLWYLQLAQGKRGDVASFTTQLAGLQWYREDLERRWPFLRTGLKGDMPAEMAVEALVRAREAEHPIYVTHIFPQGSAYLWRDHALVPDGFLLRLADSRGQDFAFNSRRTNELWSQYQLRNLSEPERKYWDDYTDVMKDAYGQACSVMGDFAMANRMPDVAQWSYTKALEYHQPPMLGVTYLKLADSELELGDSRAAIGHYQESLQRAPRGPARVFNYTPYAYARLGDAFMLEKDFISAGDAFRAALGLDPGQKQALEGLRKLGENRDRS